MRYLTAVAVVLMATGCDTPVETSDGACEAARLASPAGVAYETTLSSYLREQDATLGMLNVVRTLGDESMTDEDWAEIADQTAVRQAAYDRYQQALRQHLQQGCRFNKITGKVEASEAAS